MLLHYLCLSTISNILKKEKHVLYSYISCLYLDKCIPFCNLRNISNFPFWYCVFLFFPIIRCIFSISMDANWTLQMLVCLAMGQAPFSWREVKGNEKECEYICEEMLFLIVLYIDFEIINFSPFHLQVFKQRTAVSYWHWGSTGFSRRYAFCFAN